MSFRLEEKIFIKNLSVFDFKKWLFSKGGKILYPPRLINSVYFDNKLKMYLDSVEGVVPRKKIRIRTYNKNFFLKSNSYKKEIKSTYYNYREKISKNFDIKSKSLNIYIYDKDYGVCKPILNVNYFRNYFELNKVRITLDENIIYNCIKNNYISEFGVRDNEKVIEIKSLNLNQYDYLKDLIPLSRSRFSKYCRGVELLYLN